MQKVLHEECGARQFRVVVNLSLIVCFNAQKTNANPLEDRMRATLQGDHSLKVATRLTRVKGRGSRLGANVRITRESAECGGRGGAGACAQACVGAGVQSE